MYYGDGFSAFGVMFIVVFVIVIGTFIVTAVKGVSTWNKNNQSPRLTVPAKVVSRRTAISRHNHATGGEACGTVTTSSTRYYVTFQVESGDRMELSVNGPEYGMLAEGDVGELTFQGTRYLSFERRREER